MSRVRLSRRALSFLSGTQAWADACVLARTEVRSADPDVQFMVRVGNAPRRFDGSCSVDVNASDVAYLESAIGAWAAGAADSAGSLSDDGLDALADLNAARGLLRQMKRISHA